MPRNVPTSAAAILWPISSGSRPSAPIVMTTPMTAATMPMIHIEWLDTAARGHAYRVADEMERVMILQELRILREDRTLFGVVTVRLQRHQAFFARTAEQLEHHLQSLQIAVLAVCRGAECAEGSTEDLLQYVQWIGDEHRAGRRASDDDECCGLDEHFQISMLHQIAADDGADDHRNSDNHEHGERLLNAQLRS